MFDITTSWCYTLDVIKNITTLRWRFNMKIADASDGPDFPAEYLPLAKARGKTLADFSGNPPYEF